MLPRLSIVVLALVGCSTAEGPPLGELPDDPALRRTIRDVEAEISLRFWVDPATVADRIPPGATLTTVASYGIPDSIIGVDYQDWLDASLVVTSAQLTVDDRLSAAPPGGGDAFWWLQLDELTTDDDRTRGPDQALELGYWLPDSTAVDQLRSAGVDAEWGEATVESSGDRWQFAFRLGDTGVRGGCTLTGEVREEAYDLPAYSTVWQASRDPRWFHVFTFAGHVSQRCRVDDIQVVGRSVLANALRASLEIQDVFGIVMTGWHADGATYRRRDR